MNVWQNNVSLFALILLAVCAATPARAEAEFSGTKDHVVLQATNATMAEVLSGIQSAFNLRIQLTGSTERQFSGTYMGTLRQVLSRLLDGEDYIIGPAPDGIRIILPSPTTAGRSGVPQIAQESQLDRVRRLRQAAAAAEDEENRKQNAQRSAGIKNDPGVANQSAGSSTEDKGNPNFQGWLPSGSPVKTQSLPTGGNNSVAEPASNTEDEGNPNFQGWLPTGSSLKTVGVNQSTSEPAAATMEDEGNPNYQGWLPAAPATKATGKPSHVAP
jgi:hypothetical protein